MITAQFEASSPEASATSVRALIASPFAVVRAGYRLILETTSHSAVWEAGNTQSAVVIASTNAPQLAIVDASLPELGGIDTIQRLAELPQAPGIVMCAVRCPGELAARALSSGALGCISYEADAATVSAACSAAISGMPFLTPDLMEQVALHRVHRHRGTSATLSPREFQVLRLIAEGKPHEEIAALLELSPRSVANYKAQLMRKLDVKTTAQLVHLAIRRGVIQSIV